MAYAKIENGILWKIGLLPKAQRLTFIQSQNPFGLRNPHYTSL